VAIYTPVWTAASAAPPRSDGDDGPSSRGPEARGDLHAGHGLPRRLRLLAVTVTMARHREGRRPAAIHTPGMDCHVGCASSQ